MSEATVAAMRTTDKKPGVIPPKAIEALRKHAVTLTISRGEDGYWTLMRYLDQRGGFTPDDLTRPLREPEAQTEIKQYLNACIKAGYVVAAKARGMLQIARKQAEAPRLTKNGREMVHATRQSHLWRAMKMLGYFTIADVVVATSTGEAVMPEDFAFRYIEELETAGYLTSRMGQFGKTYRLRSAMNTGPAAPQVLRARFVWDPNTCQIVGQATRIEEVRA